MYIVYFVYINIIYKKIKGYRHSINIPLFIFMYPFIFKCISDISICIVDFGLATPSCSGVQTLVKP